MKKVGAREVVYCMNYNCFLGLDINVTLACSPVRHQIVRDVPNIAINKNDKTLCNQMPKIANE